MIKSHLQEVIKQDEQIDGVICNCCGLPIKTHGYIINDNQDRNKLIFDDFLDINQSWGYFSRYDGEVHKFNICQECYEKWVKSFKIPIDVEEYF